MSITTLAQAALTAIKSALPDFTRPLVVRLGDGRSWETTGVVSASSVGAAAPDGGYVQDQACVIHVAPTADFFAHELRGGRVEVDNGDATTTEYRIVSVSGSAVWRMDCQTQDRAL